MFFIIFIDGVHTISYIAYISLSYLRNSHLLILPVVAHWLNVGSLQMLETARLMISNRSWIATVFISFICFVNFNTFSRSLSVAIEFWTLETQCFFKNWCAVGLSFCPPYALCFPKNGSSWSWQNHSESINFTPDRANKYLIISTKRFWAALNPILFHTLLHIKTHS